MSGERLKILCSVWLAILVCQVVACAERQAQQYDNYLQGWVGQSTERLVRMWGAPQRSAQQSDGSTLLEYSERNAERVAVPVTGGSGISTGVRIENRISWCITRFTARNGVVESSTFEGTACRAP